MANCYYFKIYIGWNWILILMYAFVSFNMDTHHNNQETKIPQTYLYNYQWQGMQPQNLPSNLLPYCYAFVTPQDNISFDF